MGGERPKKRRCADCLLISETFLEAQSLSSIRRLPPYGDAMPRHSAAVASSGVL